jgi:DNA-binding transcriptional LysR family regulator
LGKLCADLGTEALKPYEGLTAKAQRGDNIEARPNPGFGIRRLADNSPAQALLRFCRAGPGIAATSFRDLDEETRDKLQKLPSHDEVLAEGPLRDYYAISRRLSGQQQGASCEG